MEELRNGLGDRSRERKVSAWIMGVSGFFLVSFFLVPAILPTDSVPELSGRANAFDYATQDGFGSWGNQQTSEDGNVGHDQVSRGSFAWTELDPYSGFIYGFGDFNCHNKIERSWEINGNQMPVCTRDVGIFFGAFLGGLLFFRRGHNRWTIRDSFLSVFPDEKLTGVYQNDRRMLALLAFTALAVIPIGIDGFTQLLTSYESNNMMRLATGTPFGLFIMWFFAASMSSRPAKFDNLAGRVRLPAGARLATSVPVNSEEE